VELRPNKLKLSRGDNIWISWNGIWCRRKSSHSYIPLKHKKLTVGIANAKLDKVFNSFRH
jgi:hypothetical protein